MLYAKWGTRGTAVTALILFLLVSCSDRKLEPSPSEEVLNLHLKFSAYTDPGKYAYLYNDLPESLEELCEVIKKQLIHPFDLGKFQDRVPKDRVTEDQAITTVSDMLAELIKRDDRGLVFDRQPENRLVVACVHHSMLLASFLRYRGIPVRIRAGWARYIGDNPRIRVSHVVCEVWDRNARRWILVDPDRRRINFPRREFEFAFQTWEKVKRKSLDKNQYVSRYGSITEAAVHLLCHDLSYMIGEEEPYWIDPPVVEKSQTGIDGLSKDEIRVLDDIALFLGKPDNYMDTLRVIQKETSFLQYTTGP